MSLPSWAQLTTGDVRGARLYWLLDLHWAGRTYHLSTDNVTAPTGDAGADVGYHAGMDPLDSITDEIMLLSDTPGSKVADLAVYLSPGESVATRIAEGHQLGSMTGQLHLWAEGADSFVTVIDGVARGASWYDDESPITFTLEESPSADVSLWPQLWATIDATTWAAHDPDVRGEYYPTVIGSPGRPAAGTLPPDGTPAYLIVTTVGSQTLLLSDGDIIGSGAAPDVTIYSESDGSSEAFTASLSEDGRGRMVSVVDVSAATTITITAGDTYWAIWDSDTNHGIVGDDKAAALTGAGDVLIWMLRKSSVRWDRGRVYAARGFLNKYQIDTFIQAAPDERISPWEWVQSNLLPILPVSARIGPGGVYFVIWDYFATSDAAVASLEWGRNAERDGAVDVDGAQIPASTVTLQYQWEPTQKSFGDKRGRTADLDVAIKLADTYAEAFDLSNAKSEYISTTSQKETAPISRQVDGFTEIVRDDFTAGLILQWWVRRDSRTTMVCDYLVAQEDAAVLIPGNVVTITDSGRGLSDRVCLVASVELSTAGMMRVGLAIPPMDTGEAV